MSSSSSSSGNSDSDESSTAVDASTAPAPATSTPRTRPPRKRCRSRATYHVRKDEIQVLHTRMEELELELQALRFQTLVPSSRERNDFSTEVIPTQAKRDFTRYLLKDAIRTQQFTLAGLQAMLSKYSSLQEISPLHASIRLPAAFDKRQELLLAARTDLLQDATRFIKERSRGMDPLKAFNEQERFDTAGGDFCVINFEILPLPSGSISVKSAFDALYFSICNVEITFSEWMGHITIRENDDESLDSLYSQHRLVATAAPTTVQVETNVVAFSEFRSSGDESEDSSNCDDGVGIIVVDSIDDDELYPYQPNERVRRDTCGVFTLQRHLESNGSEQTSAVVLMRWSLSKMHASKLLEEDSGSMREVRASLGPWGEKLVQALYETALAGNRAAREPGSTVINSDGDVVPESPVVSSDV